MNVNIIPKWWNQRMVLTLTNSSDQKPVGGGGGGSSDYNKVCGIEVTPCVFDVLPALKWWQIKVMSSVGFQMNGPG